MSAPIAKLPEGFKFDPGPIVVTRSIANDVEKDIGFRDFVMHSVSRHVNGDWGSMPKEDKAMNDQAIIQTEEGELSGRVFSGYLYNRSKIWIITEQDSSVTTVLYPHEY